MATMRIYPQLKLFMVIWQCL